MRQLLAHQLLAHGVSFILILVLIACNGAPEPDLEAEVVIYGGTSAGVIAAYTAKMQGHSVVLIEPGRHLGGLTSGGLGMTDIGDKKAITGLARDFYRRVGDYYGEEEAWRFEPHVAEQVFEQYIDEAGVEVLTLRRVVGVAKEDAAIQHITVEYAGGASRSSDLVVAGERFIDASYEGDLMGRAGVSYVVGREFNDTYSERYNGVQFPAENHQFPGGDVSPKGLNSVPAGQHRDGAPEPGPPVDPYVVPGDSSSGLLPEITGVGTEPNDTGDEKIQAYNFRMCLCQGDQRTGPIPQPEAYDPDRYELLVRDMKSNPPESLRDLFIISRMPNGKTDWNNRGAFSTDLIGKSWEYPEASYEEREKIWQAHRAYQQGLIYFLAHNERVPDHIRQEMQSWGFCRDEFLDTGGWPHALYIREARRMVGAFVMTEDNIIGDNKVEDGIAQGAYTMDSHNVQRVVVEGPEGPMVKNEGNVQVSVPGSYPVSYRSITPKRAEATNLLVPVALSASHIAFGSIRMEPVFMMLGQGAAMAASQSLNEGVTVQEVDIEALQQELRNNPLASGTIPKEAADVLRFEPE